MGDEGLLHVYLAILLHVWVRTGFVLGAWNGRILVDFWISNGIGLGSCCGMNVCNIITALVIQVMLVPV